jgi:FlaG/FlaF family flagellin (archaellin)
MKKLSTYGKGCKDAVSPVIGVILMVAITAILAAKREAIFYWAGQLISDFNHEIILFLRSALF